MTPAVFVHGNPETAAVWEPLLAELGHDDVVCLSPPGFGAALPTGFLATPEGYREWLVGELEHIGEPVDLVGHDWGGGHVVGVAMHRADLLRSWVSDAVGLFHPAYVWHELATVWQTPGTGERHVAALTGGSVAERAARMRDRGMEAAVATRVAAEQDEDMGRAILMLYRAAAQPAMAREGRQLERAAARPGLAVIATDDQFVGTEAQRREVAARAGAQVAVLQGLGHWWLTTGPTAAARMLNRFWRGLAPSLQQ